VASFTVSPSSGFAYKNNGHPGTPFTFTDNSANMGVTACNPVWSWNYGDGSGQSSLQSPPAYTYHSSNNMPGFNVTLTVTNTGGTSSATYMLRVDPS
jgi:PKD repeat protein